MLACDKQMCARTSLPDALQEGGPIGQQEHGRAHGRAHQVRVYRRQRGRVRLICGLPASAHALAAACADAVGRKVVAQLSHHAHDQAGASGAADSHRHLVALRPYGPLPLDGVLSLAHAQGYPSPRRRRGGRGVLHLSHGGDPGRCPAGLHKRSSGVWRPGVEAHKPLAGSCTAAPRNSNQPSLALRHTSPKPQS